MYEKRIVVSSELGFNPIIQNADGALLRDGDAALFICLFVFIRRIALEEIPVDVIREYLVEHEADRNTAGSTGAGPSDVLTRTFNDPECTMPDNDLVRHGVNKRYVVDLIEALAHPTWEARRLLDMAETWAEQQEPLAKRRGQVRSMSV
jgi:hypothetical protein